jgi:hypothetical protein
MAWQAPGDIDFCHMSRFGPPPRNPTIVRYVATLRQINVMTIRHCIVVSFPPVSSPNEVRKQGRWSDA